MDADIRRINECRGSQNRLGFAYQLCYVKLFNRLPTQSPFIAIEELATFVAVQLDLPREQLEEYALQQWTFSHHQEQIRAYLCVEKFSKAAEDALGDYLFHQAQQIHPKESLFMEATEFLKDKKILNPANDTIERLIQAQREKSKIYILEKINTLITQPLWQELDALLTVENESYSKLYQIKDVPKTPSAAAIKLLPDKLAMIEKTGILAIKLDWLNNNYNGI